MKCVNVPDFAARLTVDLKRCTPAVERETLRARAVQVTFYAGARGGPPIKMLRTLAQPFLVARAMLHMTRCFATVNVPEPFYARVLCAPLYEKVLGFHHRPLLRSGWRYASRVGSNAACGWSEFADSAGSPDLFSPVSGPLLVDAVVSRTARIRPYVDWAPIAADAAGQCLRRGVAGAAADRRQLEANFRRCGWGAIGCGRAQFQPSGRVQPEGRFSQMRPGGGWVWPNELHSSGRGSNRC